MKSVKMVDSSVRGVCPVRDVPRLRAAAKRMASLYPTDHMFVESQWREWAEKDWRDVAPGLTREIVDFEHHLAKQVFVDAFVASGRKGFAVEGEDES